MKRRVIGYIHFGKILDEEDRLFIKVAKKKNVELVLFDAFSPIKEEELIKKIKGCDVIFNNGAEGDGVEVSKTIEALGGRVIDPSKVYYYTEDKWMFFLKCKKHNIPTPETILLPENIKMAISRIRKFSKWPVVLKRIEGTRGEYVEKADNLNQTEKIIKKFWKKGSEKLPIVAQEFIPSSSYRVTVIGNEVVQTALKKNYYWKATGVYTKRNNSFKVDKELGRLIKKILKITNIKVCGIDFIKKGNQWLVLEINAQPAFDFIGIQREKLISKVFDLLLKELKHK